MSRLGCIISAFVMTSLVIGCGRSADPGGNSATPTVKQSVLDPMVKGQPLSYWVKIASKDDPVGEMLEALEIIMDYAKANPDTGAPAMLQLMGKGVPIVEDESVRPSEKLMPTMIQCLQSKNDDVRMWGIRMLGNLGSKAKSALPVLQQAQQTAKAKDRQLEGAWIEEAVKYINGKDAVFFPLR